MSDVVISIENLSKTYQLGTIGTGTFYGDVKRWWARKRGLPDPYQKVGEKDHGNRLGETIWALKDINIEVERGEAIGIIGRNGAGKSTLLKILSQVTAPTSGVVRAKGRIASLLEVGTGFHKELTGRENIFLNGAVMGMDRAEVRRKFDEIVDFSGVERFIDTPVKRYSSGMYVRLAFAVAAHLEPEILVVDEVLAVGDIEFQKKCLGKMQDVAGEGRTVLFVSHNMPAITSLCQRAVLLNEGRVIAIDDADVVVAQYIQLGIEAASERKWSNENAPGNDVVRLLSIRACDESGGGPPTFDIRRPIAVEIEYEVLKTGIWFTPAVLLKNEIGVILFNSAAQITPDWNNAVSISGRYQSRCWIPGNFFAEGLFVVQVTFWGFSRPPHKGIVIDDAIRFQVFDPLEGDSVRGKTTGYYPGVIRPKLEWTIEKTG
ncbi:MAG: ABC transporter ATP-binding protein [Chloroflexota bacterium]